MAIAQTEKTAVSKRVRRMFGLDLDAWNAVMVSFLGIAAVAAVVVGVSTAIIIKLQKQAELESSERIAKLVTEGDLARKETAQAKLELQQLRFPRSLDFEEFKDELKGVPKGSFEILYDPASADANSLAFTISVSLRQAGWSTDQKLPAPLVPISGPAELKDVFSSLPLTHMAGGNAWGLSVVTNNEPDLDKLTSAAAIVRALLKSVNGPSSQVSLGRAYDALPEGRVRIIVGAKLP
jgi:hypothetical protein